MLTLDDLRAVGKPRESQGTTLGTSPGRGGKYSIPDSPFPIPNSEFSLPHPHLNTVLSKTDVRLTRGIWDEREYEFLILSPYLFRMARLSPLAQLI